MGEIANGPEPAVSDGADIQFGFAVARPPSSLDKPLEVNGAFIVSIGGPWFEFCPACGGEGKKKMSGFEVDMHRSTQRGDLVAASERALQEVIGFAWKKYNWSGAYGDGPTYVFFCSTCDGKGTVVSA